jgi:multidrug resistance efflux pump
VVSLGHHVSCLSATGALCLRDSASTAVRAHLQAPMDGQVVKVLLKEGDPVEFDQTLFEIVPRMASSGSRIK